MLSNYSGSLIEDTLDNKNYQNRSKEDQSKTSETLENDDSFIQSEIQFQSVFNLDNLRDEVRFFDPDASNFVKVEISNNHEQISENLPIDDVENQNILEIFEQFEDHHDKDTPFLKGKLDIKSQIKYMDQESTFNFDKLEAEQNESKIKQSKLENATPTINIEIIDGENNGSNSTQLFEYVVVIFLCTSTISIIFVLFRARKKTKN